MLDEWLCVLIKWTWERDFASEDILVNSHWIFIVEWINSGVHFVNKNSQSPPVNGFSVALVQNDFRGNVLRSTADGECSSFIKHFSKSEICKFQVTIVSDQKILRFEVPKNNIFAMQVFKATGHNWPVESGLVSCEWFDGTQICK